MNCTLETNWQGILGIHGQFTVHLPSLGPRCQILKVGWHCLGRGVSKSHSWQPALANVSGWSCTCLTTNMLILIPGYFYREVLKDWNSLLDIATDQEILSSWARMQERSTACNKTEFRRWSQASGVDYSQHSLLLSDKLKSQNLLRPITQGRGLTGALESDSPAHLITDSPAHRIQTHPHKIQTHLRTTHLEREKPTFRFIN